MKMNMKLPDGFIRMYTANNDVHWIESKTSA